MQPHQHQTRSAPTRMLYSLCYVFVGALVSVECAKNNRNENSAGSDTDARLLLNVTKHGPCTVRPLPHERLRLANGRDSPVVPVKGEPGCYSIYGTSDVYKEIDADLFVYVELRHRPEADLPPEPCRRAVNETDCGGFGSCVYCQGCEYEKEYKKSINLAAATVVKAGKALKCGDALEKGRHKDIEIHFCLPSRRQYVEAIGEDDAYERFEEISKLYEKKNEQPVFVKFYVFDFDILRLFKQSEYDEKVKRKLLNLDASDPLPQNVYKILPFTKFINKNSMYIACHALHGMVSMQEEELSTTKNDVHRTN